MPLTYGWWKKPLPKFVKDPRNFVLTMEELVKYEGILESMKAAIEAERHEVRLNRFAIEKGRLPFYEDERRVRCTTMANLLQFMCSMAKHKLAMMEFMIEFTQARKADKETWDAATAAATVSSEGDGVRDADGGVQDEG